MKAIAFFLTSLLLSAQTGIGIRQLELNGAKVNTSFEIDAKFYGKYQGSKKGFLQLNADGSGIYNYDYAGLSKTCPGELIEFDWGFVIDENNEIVRFERPYGYSYPIIYNCSGDNAFQGCTKRTMVDYILVYDNGTITVSSSDDWEKLD
jgi:hypothetical protein